MFWRRREDDLDRELRSHLDLEAEEQRGAGLSPELARNAARRAFGSPALFREATREVWSWCSLERLVQDLRYGLRTMRRSPGFASVAVLSLALGIGANTAIFSLIHALMLRSLPVKEPETLVELLMAGRGPRRGDYFSWQTYQYLRDRNQTVADLTASNRDRFYVQADGIEGQKFEGEYVTGNYFPMLGLRPALGRLILPDDDHMGSPAHVAVLSFQLWTNRFASNPAVLGRAIRVEDQPLTIVGVAPPGFFGIQVGTSEDLYLPLALEPVLRPKTYTADAGYKWLQLLGRRKPAVSLDSIHAEMNVLFRRTLEIEAADRHEARIPNWTIDVEAAGSGISLLRDQFSKPLLVLMTIVCVLLLIACANVAGLLLARAAGRRREIALRISLGASRIRLVRQLLTESLLLSCIAAVMSILLANLGTSSLLRIMTLGRLPIELNVTPEPAILLFTAGVALVTALLFGLAPAIQFSSGSLAPTLRDRRIGRRALIAVQVAFSVVLLTAASQFVRNLASLENRDIGIHREGVLIMWLDPSHSGYQGAQLTRAYQQLLRRFEETPGIRSASIVWMPPMAGGGSEGTASVDGAPNALHVWKNWVAPHYFATVGMPLLAGRDFGVLDDARATRTVIVNQSLARRAFGDASPLGRRIKFQMDDNSYEIIGVVGDANYVEIRETAPLTAYFNTFQGRPASPFVIRTTGSPRQLSATVRNETRDLLESVVIGKITTLAEHIDGSIVQERLIAMVSGSFGALGLILAAIGLYGLLAYTIARRTNEIGVRMALGANRGDVIRMVLREASQLVLAGLAIGAPLAFASEYAASRIIPNLPPGPWIPVGIGVAVMIAAGVLAAFLPARRASRVDPMVALRYE